jgi:hypothetical protein
MSRELKPIDEKTVEILKDTLSAEKLDEYMALKKPMSLTEIDWSFKLMNLAILVIFNLVFIQESKTLKLWMSNNFK